LLQLVAQSIFHPFHGVAVAAGLYQAPAFLLDSLGFESSRLLSAAQSEQGFNLGRADPEQLLGAGPVAAKFRFDSGCVLQQTIANFQDIFPDASREKPIDQSLIALAAGRANVEHECVVDAVIIV